MGSVYKSHIQITRSLLGNFSHREFGRHEGKPTKTDCVYCLDTRSGAVDIRKVSSFGTAENYYDPDVEEGLAKGIESPFGDLASRLIKTDWGGIKGSCSPDDIKVIRNFISISVFRARRNHADPAIAASASAFGAKLTPSMTLREALKRKREWDPFLGMSLTLLFNLSSRDFVIPYNCLSILNLPDGDAIFFPFAPKRCFVLMGGGKTAENPAEQGMDFEQLGDERSIEFINNRALFTEIKNEGLVIGSDRSELERLAAMPKDGNGKPN